VMQDEWRGRTGASWAAEWRRTDRSFSALTERLLERIRPLAFTDAVDIGCGAGELSLALASGWPSARVTGVDISTQLIDVARDRAGSRANIAFEVADAAQWRPADKATPDLIVSRHGVMFFADPQAAFSNLAEIAAPNARLLFSCFRDRADNPFFSEVARLLPAPPKPGDPHEPGPFAFADNRRVEAILAAAGWRDLEVVPFDFAMVAGSGDDPIGDAVSYFTRIGPAARALAEFEADERERFTDRVRAMAEKNLCDGVVALRAAAWIFAGHKR
jgi:SAM-dependent methyltransferase